MDPKMCEDSLSMPLPEDILKRKWAGDLEGAIKAIDVRLKKELPDMLRARLECEKERIRRLPTQYPWNREQALAKLQELVPAVTEEQFDEWELQGRIDFIYIKGEKRYFLRCHRSIAKNPELVRLAGREVKPDNDWLDPMIREIKEQGSLTYRITMDSSVYVEKEDFVPGEYLVHMPFPAKSAQQSDIRVIEGEPDGIAPEDAPARTAHWRRQLEAWQAFGMKYSFVSSIKYADPLHQPAPKTPLYPDVPAPCADDLAESGAFMRFTPYLKALAADVVKGAATDLEKAWKCYEFVTTKVDYSFMRDYFQVDNLNEFCAVNMRGDCGLQALLFIILCRINGIPARWQSGLSLEPDYCGGHDWAQFYLEGWGWLFADCSYGGSAYRFGAEERHAFFFGNLEPLRLVANREFQAPLSHELDVLRVDPYDNQCGEIQRFGAELPFTMRQTDICAKLVNFEKM